MNDGIPSKIGRYDIDRLIGSGAMGFVFLGRDPELDRAVAIKTLRDLNMGADALKTFLERFRNEARAAARLHHHSIVQVYDVGEDEEVGPYLVFEYVPGSTLKQIIKSRGPLPPPQVVGIAEQIGDAIDAAHEREIIHRDIKPDNLLVTKDGRVKLADFGVARIPNAALTREGQFLGTPCYAAPETLKQGDYGPHSDLFSFAAVLYEAVSGVRAFPGDDAVAVAHKVIHDEPPPASEVARGVVIPPEVDAVLKRGLSKDPKRRHDTALGLTRALREAFERAGLVNVDATAETVASTARPLSSLGRGAPPTPERRGRDKGSNTLAFGAVLAGALAVGIAVVFAFGRGDGAADTVDAGPWDAGTADAGDRGGGEVVPDRPRPDAGPADAGIFLLGPETEDAGPESAEDIASMTAHDREERAKDAIDRAERALAAGDTAAARAAVAEARRFDPGNPDIEALEARLAN